MPEYFSVNLNLGKKGNSIERVSLYACSGSTESTCEATPISGYDNVLWVDSKFSPQYQTSPEFSITGLTTFLTNLILYKHTYVMVKVKSSYYGSCDITRMIPISGIPTPTPTPTPTSTPTPTPTSTPTITPTPTLGCFMSGGSVSFSPDPTPTPTPTSTSTPTVTPTSTVTPTPTATSTGPTFTPTPTPTATPTVTYTYLAACSGGTILGWIQGEYTQNQQVSIGGDCYVTTFTTISPTQGSLIIGTPTWEACCPTATPTPTPVPVGYGVYTGATFGNATLACADGNYPSVTLYIANGDTISNGDILYVQPGLTEPFNGNDNYYHIFKNSGRWAATISGGGYVSNLTDCNGLPPTPTPTPTITPTPTFIPYDMIVYTGTTLINACANTTPTTVYYDGALVVGTILYAGPGYTNPIPPTLYLKYSNAEVFLIGTPSVDDGVVTEIVACATPTPTPTPTATPGPILYSYDGCGRGTSPSASCNDNINYRTFYSYCDSGSFGVGCTVYVDIFPNQLTGYGYVYINGATWDVNTSTGVVERLSSEQC
jgi:hypothetical protein